MFEAKTTTKALLLFTAIVGSSACEKANAADLDVLDATEATALMNCWGNGIDLILTDGVSVGLDAVSPCIADNAAMTFRFPGQDPITVEGRAAILQFIAEQWAASSYVLARHLGANVVVDETPRARGSSVPTCRGPTIVPTSRRTSSPRTTKASPSSRPDAG